MKNLKKLFKPVQRMGYIPNVYIIESHDHLYIYLNAFRVIGVTNEFHAQSIPHPLTLLKNILLPFSPFFFKQYFVNVSIYIFFSGRLMAIIYFIRRISGVSVV